MTDKVTTYSLNSLARYINVNVSGVTAYVVTPDFDWDKKPNPAAPGNTVLARPLPFVGIVLKTDEEPPWSIGNILYEKNILLHVELCSTGFTDLVDQTSQMKQSLRAAVNPDTNNVGITLYNFALASGSYFANAGTMRVEIGKSEYFGPDDTNEQGNRKYRSVTLMELSAFKDNTATLLENMGRISINDS